MWPLDTKFMIKNITKQTPTKIVYFDYKKSPCENPIAYFLCYITAEFSVFPVTYNQNPLSSCLKINVCQMSTITTFYSVLQNIKKGTWSLYRKLHSTLWQRWNNINSHLPLFMIHTSIVKHHTTTYVSFYNETIGTHFSINTSSTSKHPKTCHCHEG